MIFQFWISTILLVCQIAINVDSVNSYFVVYLFKIVSLGVMKVFAILVVLSLNLGFVETSDASTVYTLFPVLSAFASPGATARST